MASPRDDPTCRCRKVVDFWQGNAVVLGNEEVGSPSLNEISLNERERKHDSEVPVGKLFFSTPRTKQQCTRHRNNNDYWKMTVLQTFLQQFITSFKIGIKDLFYKIRIILNNIKKEITKQSVSEILQNRNMLPIKINNHFYNYVLDIITTKTYKFKQIALKNK